jgi:hypothetical protein
MDNFIATILVLHDNINETATALKKSKKSLAKNSVSEKQYLAYYVYRIWIKYRKLISNVNTPSEFNKVLAYLEIPNKYYDMEVVYPLVNKMTSNENQLDYVILNIMNQMNKVAKLYSKPDAKAPEQKANTPDTGSKDSVPDTTPKSAEYDQLVNYLEGKNTENIVQDIIQLKLLIPNLARPAQKFDIWGTYMPYLKDLEALIKSESEEQALAASAQEQSELPPELLTMLAASGPNQQQSEAPIPQQQSASADQAKP